MWAAATRSHPPRRPTGEQAPTMIRYTLACDAGHAFESWFPSSASYDAQAARGLVTCPACDSARVAKRVMAPAVARTDRAKAALPVPAAPSPRAAPSPAAVALVSEPERQMRAMLRALREHVRQNSDHVGERFAHEARRMHYGEAETRSIHGEVTPDDARALLDEGIEIFPLPAAPDDRH